MGIFWGVLTGLFLAGGNYFMSQAARTIRFDGSMRVLVVDAFHNHALYLFVFFNFCATITYLLCLRDKQLLNGFAVTTVTVSAAVFVVSVVVTRIHPTAGQVAGFLLAVMGVVLMNRT